MASNKNANFPYWFPCFLEVDTSSSICIGTEKKNSLLDRTEWLKIKQTRLCADALTD